MASISLALFWPVSRTLLYRELERLTELGWVEASRVEISTPAARSGRIVADHGITTTRARLEWASDAERQLTDRGSRRRSSASD